MSPFIEKLEEYGVNIQPTLERFVDNEDLYKKCLNLLINDTNFIELEKNIEEEKYSEAFNAAHALKGAVGNLGLTPLYDKICIIVELLRKEEYYELKNLYESMNQEYNNVKRLLEL